MTKRTMFFAMATAVGLAAAGISSSIIIAAADSPAAATTFTKDVAPIMMRSCVECHRPGQLAPFSVLSYEDVRPWARSIKNRVTKREMPPWNLDPTVGSTSIALIQRSSFSPEST